MRTLASTFFSYSGRPVVWRGCNDHVILFDTSASQAGAHRQQGLAVLEACLASLATSDRVRLVAVDSQIKPLADGFIAPQSPEMPTEICSTA